MVSTRMYWAAVAVRNLVPVAILAATAAEMHDVPAVATSVAVPQMYHRGRQAFANSTVHNARCLQCLH
jgi:hypothetical protein